MLKAILAIKTKKSRNSNKRPETIMFCITFDDNNYPYHEGGGKVSGWMDEAMQFHSEEAARSFIETDEVIIGFMAVEGYETAYPTRIKS